MAYQLASHPLGSTDLLPPSPTLSSSLYDSPNPLGDALLNPRHESPIQRTFRNTRRHHTRNATRVGRMPRGLGFSLKPPSWLTSIISGGVKSVEQIAAQALAQRTNVTIGGRTYNLANPADVAALRALASNARVSVTNPGQQTGPSAAPPEQAGMFSNPWVIAGFAAAAFLLLKRSRG